MIGSRIVDTIDEQKEWLNPIDSALSQAVQSAYDAGGPAGQAIANFLHGTWLGHPLHPVLTDVPVGAWTASTLFDIVDQISGNDDLADASDAAVALGIAGAAGSALSGITDWKDADSQSSRIGLVHATLNTIALILYIVSLVLRRNGSRAAGRNLAYLGYGIVSASAYLGGELVYRQRMGVNHTTDEKLPTADFIPVMAAADLPEGELRKAQAGKWPIVLARCDGEICAIAEVCSHMGGPLAEGDFEENCSVRCPWHGSRFSLKDGHVIDGPATLEVPSFETRVVNGQIEVRGRTNPLP